MTHFAVNPSTCFIMALEAYGRKLRAQPCPISFRNRIWSQSADRCTHAAAFCHYVLARTPIDRFSLVAEMPCCPQRGMFMTVFFSEFGLPRIKTASIALAYGSSSAQINIAALRAPTLSYPRDGSSSLEDSRASNSDRPMIQEVCMHVFVFVDLCRVSDWALLAASIALFQPGAQVGILDVIQLPE
ncbi:hypothetical protein CPB85DRAFT_1255369 [Mucidula mucida]|nr:hypothetical protein CPB85DRAFT_1255369 [Mucidula mucida]